MKMIYKANFKNMKTKSITINLKKNNKIKTLSKLITINFRTRNTKNI